MRYLTQQQIKQLVTETFLQSMPFNQLLGLQLVTLDEQQATVSFQQNSHLIGNVAQAILHGGVVAAAMDVTAGIVSVYHTLSRLEIISDVVLKQKLARMGTVDLKVDYLRPGAGQEFLASATLLRAGNKIAVSRIELLNEQAQLLAAGSATYLIG